MQALFQWPSLGPKVLFWTLYTSTVSSHGTWYMGGCKKGHWRCSWKCDLCNKDPNFTTREENDIHRNTQPKDFGFSGCVGCFLSEIHTVIGNSAIRCYCKFYCLASTIMHVLQFNLSLMATLEYVTCKRGFKPFLFYFILYIFFRSRRKYTIKLHLPGFTTNNH